MKYYPSIKLIQYEGCYEETNRLLVYLNGNLIKSWDSDSVDHSENSYRSAKSEMAIFAEATADALQVPLEVHEIDDEEIKNTYGTYRTTFSDDDLVAFVEAYEPVKRGDFERFSTFDEAEKLGWSRASLAALYDGGKGEDGEEESILTPLLELEEDELYELFKEKAEYVLFSLAQQCISEWEWDDESFQQFFDTCFHPQIISDYLEHHERVVRYECEFDDASEDDEEVETDDKLVMRWFKEVLCTRTIREKATFDRDYLMLIGRWWGVTLDEKDLELMRETVDVHFKDYKEGLSKLANRIAQEKSCGLRGWTETTIKEKLSEYVYEKTDYLRTMLGLIVTQQIQSRHDEEGYKPEPLQHIKVIAGDDDAPFGYVPLDRNQ